jgi:hypothetical protein
MRRRVSSTVESPGKPARVEQSWKLGRAQLDEAVVVSTPPPRAKSAVPCPSSGRTAGVDLRLRRAARLRATSRR